MSEEEHPHFNLVDEPWIMVRDGSGRFSEVSLLEVFEKAPNLDSLVNETPQQDFAILRVLLAIVQRSLNDSVEEFIDDGLYPSDVWGEMWKARALPVEDIRAYLEKWHHRFDLFDDEAPFMQAAGLEATSGKVADARKLLCVSENKPALTPMRTGARESNLLFDEAARWLITAQAFDVAGAKTGAAGDPRLKKGKGYPGGSGWAGRLGCVYAQGETLAETLLLNTILCSDGRDFDEWFSDDDAPCWEREPQPCFMTEETPLGRTDLYTWQSRRARLVASGREVTGVVFTVGNITETVNKNGEEWFSAWRRNAKAERRLGKTPAYLPVKHSSSKAMWRGLDSILPVTSDDAVDEYLAPGVVEWIGFLASQNGGEQIESSRLVRLRAIGLEYDKQQSSSIVASVDDELEMSAFLLSPQGELANASAKSVMKVTERAVAAFGEFAAALVRADGFKSDGKRSSKSNPEIRAKDAAKAEAYFYFDEAFRSWLASLDEQSDLAEREDTWARLVVSSFRKELVRDLLSQINPSTIVGHLQKKGWENAAQAQATFFRNLGKCLEPLILKEEEEA